jgi:hypothetical protein
VARGWGWLQFRARCTPAGVAPGLLHVSKEMPAMLAAGRVKVD